MILEGLKVGIGITGSFCTFEKVIPQMQRILDEGAQIIPIMSYTAATTDTRFGKISDFKDKIKTLTGKDIVDTLVDAEPLGPNNKIDVMVIAPCTGNTLAKLANAITDSPVLMATKAHLRNNKPVVISISTNDALGLNAKNLGLLLATKGVFFVPFGQDNPLSKPNSLISDITLVVPTIVEAMNGKQIQPIILGSK